MFERTQIFVVAVTTQSDGTIKAMAKRSDAHEITVGVGEAFGASYGRSENGIGGAIGIAIERLVEDTEGDK